VKTWFISGLLALLGSLLSLAYFMGAIERADAHTRDEVAAAATQLHHALEGVIDAELAVLSATRLFFEASVKVEPGEFDTFTTPLLEEHRALLALEWVEALPDAERAAFEARQMARQAGFQLTERGTGGGPVVRARAESYAPIVYAAPSAGTERALGFDVASDETGRAMLSAARRTDRPTASARVETARDKRPSILLVMAVHASNEPTRLMGYVLGVCQIEAIVAAARAEVERRDRPHALRLEDLSAPPETRRLFEDPATSDAGDYQVTREFFIGGRLWRLGVRPSAAFVAATMTQAPVLWLSVGLLLTLALTTLGGITLRRKALVEQQVAERTAALHASEVKIRAVLDTVGDGIVSADARGKILLANRSAERMFGFEPGTLVGHNVEVLMPEPMHSAHSAYLRRHSNIREAHVIGREGEVEALRQNGEHFPARLVIGQAEVGGTSQFVAVVVDITAQKEAERALIAAKTRAEEANRFKTEFLRNMSHELRTPLAVVLGNVSELTQAEAVPADPAVTAAIARDIEASGRHLLQLINGLLEVSQIEAGRLTLKCERVAVGALVQEVLQSLTVLAQARGDRLIGEGDAVAWADPLRLRQMLVNIVGNAIRFTEGGTIAVASAAIGGKVTITITDDGCGMSAEDLAALKRPLSEMALAVRSRGGGAGFGLTITRQLAEAHGGSLNMTSAPGRGTVVSLTLPVERPA